MEELDNSQDREPLDIQYFIGPWTFILICGCCILFGYLLGSISTITLNFH